MWLNARASSSEAADAFVWIGNFLAIMLLTPHLYPHDLSLLIVPNALILKLRGEQGSALVPVSLVILGILPILPLALGIYLPPIVPLILLAGFFWCLRFMF
jgi:hypothetical protein